MIILEEAKQYLVEVLLPAKNEHLKILRKQMDSNKELKYTLTTPIRNLPKYKYLLDGTFLQARSLFEIIEYSLKFSDIESYFMKTSKGILVGFIAVSIEKENNKKIVNDIKLFSFGLSSKEDEDIIRKDVPDLMDVCLKKYSKVMWTAHRENKAIIAYDIFCKRKKGTWEDAGKYRRYTCYSK